MMVWPVRKLEASEARNTTGPTASRTRATAATPASATAPRETWFDTMLKRASALVTVRPEDRERIFDRYFIAITAHATLRQRS